MDEKIRSWIGEIRRFNPRLHLMGPGMIQSLEDDAILLADLLANLHEAELADVGSGGGLAAAVAKALHPDMHVVCIDRSEKKCTFLRHAAQRCGLEDLEIVCEDLAVGSSRSYNALMARSFSPSTTLRTVCQRMLPQEGRLYYISSGHAPDLGAGFRMEHESVASLRGKRLRLTRFRRLRS